MKNHQTKRYSQNTALNMMWRIKSKYWRRLNNEYHGECISASYAIIPVLPGPRETLDILQI